MFVTLKTMLTSAQMKLVKAQLGQRVPVSENAQLKLVNQIGNKRFYKENAHLWQFDYQNGAVVGVHRRLNYFA